MKRFCALLLSFVLILSLSPAAAAASSEATAAADKLYSLGLFQGKGYTAGGSPIYALDDLPSRQEAVTMLVRLLGKETEAKAGKWNIPFTDVDAWAVPYVGYAYRPHYLQRQRQCECRAISHLRPAGAGLQQ